MALMNDDDDWDMDDTNVPAPMDSAKARLNQTTAVFAGRQNIHERDVTLERQPPPLPFNRTQIITPFLV